VGPVYQAGTLSGNPLAMACGLATLAVLKQSNPYPQLERKTQRLAQGLSQAAQAAGIANTVAHVGSMFTLFFHDQPVTNYTIALQCDTQRFAKYFWRMLERGIYLPCSQFEANFVSTAHQSADIEATITAAQETFQKMTG
jgi:glutamate-1-semialdehyde 2,1-aminomutase